MFPIVAALESHRATFWVHDPHYPDDDLAALNLVSHPERDVVDAAWLTTYGSRRLTTGRV